MDSRYVNPSGWQLTACYLLGLGVNWLLIWIHELGHGVGGWMVGIRIKEIRIGHWRRLCWFRVGTLSVDIRILPSGGAVALERTPLPSLKSLGFFLGGVVATSMTVAIAWLSGRIFLTGPEGMGHYWIRSLRMFVICFGIWEIVANLIPHKSKPFGITSDGGQILALMRARTKIDPEIAALALKVTQWCEQKNWVAALEGCRELSRRKPGNAVVTLQTALVYYELGQTEDGIALLEPMANDSRQRVKDRMRLYDALASAATTFERSDLVLKAEEWARIALAIDNSDLPLMSTAGALLVQLGRDHEAIPLLRAVIRYGHFLHDRALAHAALGHIQQKRGNFRRAAHQFHRASALAKASGLQRIGTAVDRLKCMSS